MVWVDDHMLYYIIRRREDKEPLALVRFNSNEKAQLVIGKPFTHPRFGVMAPVTRFGIHRFNLMIGDNKEVEDAINKELGYQLELTTQAEWETFDVLELFPVLKLAMAK